MTALPRIAVLAVSCLLAGCGEDRPLQAGDTAGLIRAGYSEEPPYSWRDREGRVTGEAPEMLRLVAGSLRIDSIRWVRLEFEQLIPALLEGRVDVLAAGMFITPERASRVRFSRPTSCAGAALVRRRHDDRPLASMDEFVGHATAKVAVIAGTVEEQALRLLAVPPERILLVPDVRTGAVAVQLGVADVMAVTLPTASQVVEADTSGMLVAVGPYDPPPGTDALLSGCSALAFRPEDEVLASTTDCALMEFVGTPAHVALLARFGFNSASVPDEDATHGFSSEANSCSE